MRANLLANGITGTLTLTEAEDVIEVLLGTRRALPIHKFKIDWVDESRNEKDSRTAI